MNKLTYNGLIMLSIITLTFSACKKDKETDDREDVTSVTESAQADETFSDSFIDISTISTESATSFTSSMPSGTSTSSINTSVIGTSCAIVTVSPQGNVWPKTLTFDFGTGCVTNDVTRKGKIIAVFTDRFKNAGSKITVTFDNYYVNDTKIEGTKTIVNNGKNTAGNYTFTLEVSKSRISSTRGAFTCNSTKVIEWTKGESTERGADDVFSITGSSSGTNSKEQAFTLTITKPLIKKVECRFLVAGTVESKTGSRLVRTLDYGTGLCDAKATVTIGEVTKEISLRK